MYVRHLHVSNVSCCQFRLLGDVQQGCSPDQLAQRACQVRAGQFTFLVHPYMCFALWLVMASWAITAVSQPRGMRAYAALHRPRSACACHTIFVEAIQLDCHPFSIQILYYNLQPSKHGKSVQNHILRQRLTLLKQHSSQSAMQIYAFADHVSCKLQGKVLFHSEVVLLRET